MGTDYSRGKEVRFSWNGLVVPACKECNGEYSRLETRAKEVVGRLLKREAVAARDYVTLLDWLDKVRTGLWINYHLIQNHPVEVSPNFYVNQRVGQKDRMLAIYPLQDHPDGLNAFGVNSLVFAEMPSCFMLRINDLLLLNASTDFAYSHGCGFPHPATITKLAGGENAGRLLLEGLSYDHKVKSRISDFDLIKPSVWLFQPIMLPDDSPRWRGGYWGVTGTDSFLATHSDPEFPGQGILFRQFEDRVVPLFDPSQAIEFDGITGSDRRPAKEIIAQTYEYQVHLFRKFPFDTSDGDDRTEADQEYERMMIESTLRFAEFYRSQ
ncbi:hypothetical protein BB934_45470 (plasmid) [Microvirga ossetica]|uniref:Uncharacterized protein n=2 Tax=Microvirga ossetica TaxID=1882682 RepID=A0A1B2EZW4_9HYPH|nr:hypothetical protein BB934_45470 [Microvirga ossetica]